MPRAAHVFSLQSFVTGLVDLSMHRKDIFLGTCQLQYLPYLSVSLRKSIVQCAGVGMDGSDDDDDQSVALIEQDGRHVTYRMGFRGSRLLL